MTNSRRYRLKTATWIVVRDPDQPSPRQLRSTASAALLARDIVAAHDDDKEHFWIILLNRRLHYLMHTMVSMGSQTDSVVHPREIFGPALREGATGVILIHNHPSGDPLPSQADHTMTRRLVDVGELLGIAVHDHIIVGNGNGIYISMAERGQLVGTGRCGGDRTLTHQC